MEQKRTTDSGAGQDLGDIHEGTLGLGTLTSPGKSPPGVKIVPEKVPGGLGQSLRQSLGVPSPSKSPPGLPNVPGRVPPDFLPAGGRTLTSPGISPPGVKIVPEKVPGGLGQSLRQSLGVPSPSKSPPGLPNVWTLRCHGSQYSVVSW